MDKKKNDITTNNHSLTLTYYWMGHLWASLPMLKPEVYPEISWGECNEKENKSMK
jgi:hypothetical protein